MIVLGSTVGPNGPNEDEYVVTPMTGLVLEIGEA